MKILLINQTFYPDVVSTSQHLTDLAGRLVLDGHQVSVITGSHGYDDSSKRFKSYEEFQGVKINRIYYLSLGKFSKLTRFLDFASFNFCLITKLMFFPKQDIVVGLTSPPLVAVFGNLFCGLRGGRFIYWVMDMNPDEAIAAGWLKEKSLTGRFLTWVSRWIFQKSHKIIALDRFMKQKIVDRYQIPEGKIAVMPPWAHDEQLHPIKHEENPFRQVYSLKDKFVVMYSGNHSPCHPLATVLGAASRCREDTSIIFCFIGGGSRISEVKEFKEKHRLQNILQFGYVPIDKLSESLSAADLHITVMGNEFVGIVHPCKIYGILSVGRPFVFIGPKESAMGDFVKESGLGIQLEHGDVQGLVESIQKARGFGAEEKTDIEVRSIKIKNERFSHSKLCSKLASFVEKEGRDPSSHKALAGTALRSG